MTLKVRALLFALILTTAALGNITQFSMNTMLPAINAELGMDGSLSSWLATAYIMTVGIFVPVAPFVFKKLGPKRTILVSASVLALGSAVDCLATSFGFILAGRLLQAAATGIATPIMQTAAIAWFPDNIRGRMLGITGLVMGFAGSFGPTAGGFCVDLWGWRSYFLVLGLLAVVMAVLGAFTPKEAGETIPTETPDVLSLLLSTFSFSLVLLGFSNAASSPLLSPEVLVPVLVGGALLVAFVARQNHSEKPLISMEIFKSKSYIWGFAGLCLANLSFMGTTLAVPLYVQGCLNASATEAALVMLPASLVTLVMNPLAGSIVDRFGERPASLVFGCVLVLGSFLGLTYDANSSLVYVAAVHLVRSIGMAGIIAPMLSCALAGLDTRIMPDGSSFMVVCRQVAAAIGASSMASAIVALTGAANPALPYFAAMAIAAVVSLTVLACIVVGVKNLGRIQR